MSPHRGRVPALLSAGAYASGIVIAGLVFDRPAAPPPGVTGAATAAALLLCAPAAVHVVDSFRREKGRRQPGGAGGPARPHVPGQRAGALTDALLLAALCLAGALGYGLSHCALRRDDVALTRLGERVALSGTVCEWRAATTRTAHAVLRVAGVAADLPGTRAFEPASGLVWVTWPREADAPAVGDSVIVVGVLTPPTGRRNPGGFDFARYLRDRRVRATLRRCRLERRGDAARRLRPDDWVSREVERRLPGTTGDVLKALLLGRSSALPPEVRDSFRRSGTVHVLAVSGLHVGFIVLIVHALLRTLRVPRGVARALVVPFLALFVALVGARPSVVRAAVMATSLVVSSLLERKTNPLNSLGAAALVLLVVRPGALFDLGFRLSFSAVGGILLFHAPLTRAFERLLGRLGGRFSRLAAPLALSVSAQAGVSTALIASVGELSLVAPIANLAAVPAAAASVAAGAAMLASGPMGTWPSDAFCACAWLSLTVLRATAERLSAPAWASVRVPCSLWPAFLAATLGACVWATCGSRRGRRATLSLATAAASLAAVILLVGPGRSRPRVIFFDVGQGDSILIEFRRGHRLLIDAGPGPVGRPGPDGRAPAAPGYDAGEHVVVPYLRRACAGGLDALLVTHAHSDHLGGAASVLRSVRVARLVLSPGASRDVRYSQVVALAGERGVPVREVGAGDTLLVGGSCVRVLSPPRRSGRPNGAPPSENDRSVVTVGDVGGFSVLMTGDIEERAENTICAGRDRFEVDVLKVAHHGGATSSGASFLERASPVIAVAQVGAGNRYGHPEAAALRRLEAAGATVFRTDLDGAVMVTSGSNGLDVSCVASGRRLVITRGGDDPRPPAAPTPRGKRAWAGGGSPRRPPRTGAARRLTHRGASRRQARPARQ